MSSTTQHPLDPLSAAEINAISLVVRKYVAAKTPVQAFLYIGAELVLPPKRDVLAHLGIRAEPGVDLKSPVDIARKADVDILDAVTGQSWVLHLTLKDDQWAADGSETLPGDRTAQISIHELHRSEEVVRADERVRELAARAGVSPDQIHADGWSLGFDERFPDRPRLLQCLLFARFKPDDNHYAHPLTFVPVVDLIQNKVICVDLPGQNFDSEHRGSIPPPTQQYEYLPDHLGTPNVPREPLKLLQILQPDGVSFKISGNVLEWQQWKLHIGFTPREGIVLSTVTYNDAGEIRPILYRASCAEMVAPYGSPDPLYNRRFSPNMGNVGLGLRANDLSLGCDCLGSIHYLPGSFLGHDGEAVTIKKAICIHEEDTGILWKHTDSRPGGRSHLVRSRKLVISMVCTVKNFEYVFYWNLYLDGTIELVVRLTGILSISRLPDGEKPTFGTEVAPGIISHYHQHLFSIRVDPMVDGVNNTVIQSDVISYDNASGSHENLRGNGITVHNKTITHSSGLEYNQENDRLWRITNPARKHHASGEPVAYSVDISGATRNLLARHGSQIWDRVGFASKAVWVVPEDEGVRGGRRWPAGRYIPLRDVPPTDSVVEWAKKEEKVDNQDILLFLTVGLNHIPRPEDWPVMPSADFRVMLKPVGFFRMNPAVDVQAPVDERSCHAFPA